MDLELLIVYFFYVVEPYSKLYYSGEVNNQPNLRRFIMATFAEKRCAYEFMDTFVKPVFNGFVDAIGRAMDKTELVHCKEQISIINKDIERLEREMLTLKWYNLLRKIEIRDALEYRIELRGSYRKRIAELEARLGGV